MDIGKLNCLFVGLFLICCSTVHAGEKPWAGQNWDAKNLKKEAKEIFGPPGQINKGKLPRYSTLANAERDAKLVEFFWKTTVALDAGENLKLADYGIKPNQENKVVFSYEENPQLFPLSMLLAPLDSFIQLDSVQKALIERGVKAEEIAGIIEAIENYQDDKSSKNATFRAAAKTKALENNSAGLSNRETMLEFAYQQFQLEYSSAFKKIISYMTPLSNQSKRAIISYFYEVAGEGTVYGIADLDEQLVLAEQMLLAE